MLQAGHGCCVVRVCLRVYVCVCVSVYVCVSLHICMYVYVFLFQMRASVAFCLHHEQYEELYFILLTMILRVHFTRGLGF